MRLLIPSTLLIGLALSGCWWPSPDSLPTPTPPPGGETPDTTSSPTSSPTATPASATETPVSSPSPMPSPDICLNFLDENGDDFDNCGLADAYATYQPASPNGPITVASLGDLDGDGVDDLALMPTLADSKGVTDGGAVLLYYGASGGIDLEAPDAMLTAAVSGDMVATAASAGDVNGDGYVDLLVGASRADVSEVLDTGAAYLICGGPDRIAGTLALNLQNTDVVFSGNSPQFGAGQVAISAGRFNGDEFDDILITAATFQNGDGHAFVFYGSEGLCGRPGKVISVFDADVDLHLLKGSGENLGWAAASLGDLDGDGFNDVALGAPADAADLAGGVYVVFGGDYPAHSDIVLAAQSSNFFRIEGERPGDRLGAALAGGIDLNDDGHPDLVVGAPGFDTSGKPESGIVYLLTALTRQSGSNQLEIEQFPNMFIPGPSPDSGFGETVALLPDINGDGVNDFLVGAETARQHGMTMLFGGAAQGNPGQLTLLEGEAPTDGFGAFVAAANLDGAGPPELIISASKSGAADVGAVYLYRVPE